MEYFLTVVLAIFYKLLALIPLVLILIAIIKLQRRSKNIGTGLMLAGNVGLILKVAILDSFVDYFIRYSNSDNVRNVGFIMSILGLIGFAFSFLFGLGFLIFVIKLLKAEKNLS